jgi:6-phosphogluconolactonase
MSGTVTAFAWDRARGILSELQTVNALPPDFMGEIHSAEVQVSPGGKFLYVSNRGPETLGVFSIAPKGILAAIGQVPSGGLMPRGFSLDPTGAWLFAANQKSDNITLFQVDRKTGRLQASGQKLSVGAPVCVVFRPL